MIGHGATLEGSSTGTLGKLVNINWSGLMVEDIDVSNFDSTGKWREYESGFKDNGEITAELIFDATLMDTLIDAFGGDNETWTLTLNDGNALVCEGHIRSLGLTVPMEDAVKIPVSIKLSGQPYWPSFSGA
jgi:predicted secreted protein